MDQSNWSVQVEYISIFHPNIPPLILGMVNGYVATDTVVPSVENILCTLLLLLLTGTIFSYFCMSSITSVLILAILIAIVLF